MSERYRISQGYNDRYCHDLQTNELLNQSQTVKKLNVLQNENRQLLCLITEILDYIESNEGVTVEEMGKWWRIKEKELEFLGMG